MNPVQTMVSQFVDRLQNVINAEVQQRITGALSAAGLAPKRGPGRPPKVKVLWGEQTTNVVQYSPTGYATPRKPRVKQLCPVPNCKNAAAPVFGMVCSEHKDVPKKVIARHREARRIANGLKNAPTRTPAQILAGAKKKTAKAKKSAKK